MRRKVDVVTILCVTIVARQSQLVIVCQGLIVRTRKTSANSYLRKNASRLRQVIPMSLKMCLRLHRALQLLLRVSERQARARILNFFPRYPPEDIP